MNNTSGYNSDKPHEFHPILWVSSFQGFYMFCILPFFTKRGKVFVLALVPYIVLLIISTNIFLHHNGYTFNKDIYVYHFVNLVSNYLIIVLSCNLFIYYKCRNQTVITSRQEYIINYNIVPHIRNITTKECANDACSICMENIIDERLNVKTKCGHTFHKECIDRWVSFNNNICPNCRKNIIV